MTEYATADDLIESLDLPEDDFTLPNGRVIRLRGLSRFQLFFNGKGTEDNAVIEARNLVSCCVQPALSLEQANALLRRIGAGPAGQISQRIRELSGLAEGADKSNVAEARD